MPPRDRILVTGATGTVGADVLDLLAAEGCAVRAAVRRPRPDSPVEQVRFDFADPSTHAAALDGVDRVFLMRPPAVTDVAREVRPFIDRLAAARVRHVAFLSVIGAEKNPFVPHHGIERALRQSGVPTTYLRAGFFMQNLEAVHRDEIRDLDAIYIPAGRGRTSFVDTRDLAAVAARTLVDPPSGSRAFDLTGSEALDYHDVAAHLSRALGRPIRYAAPSSREFRRRMLARGLPPPMVTTMQRIYFIVRLGLAARITGDLARFLGRPPRRMADYARDRAALWQRPAASARA